VETNTQRYKERLSDKTFRSDRYSDLDGVAVAEEARTSPDIWPILAIIGVMAR